MKRALLLVAVLATAGCGGSASKSSSAAAGGITGPSETPGAARNTPVTTSPTSSQAARAASSGSGFCTQLSQALGQLVSNNSPDVSKTISGLQAARDRLQGLSPPTAAQTDYQRFISSLSSWINDLKAGNSAAAQRDTSAVISAEHAAGRAAGCH